ncbi:MAG: hypothetical protein IJQ04_00915 [Prevotella sp.]|nr:hypothetical protein [Prevotella sp.]
MRAKRFFNFLVVALLSCSVAVMLTACSKEDNPVNHEVTLEDALNDGTIVAFTFEVNSEEFYVAFVRVGDTYELLDYGTTRAAGKALTRADEPTIKEEDCVFTMEHDKANNVIKLTVKEKKTSDLVLTAFIDVTESTMEVIPGDPKYKVTNVKMKVSNVEITKLLKEKGEGVKLSDALVKGAKVEIVYKWDNSNTTTFTFTNDGGTFSCAITGDNPQQFNSFLRLEDNVLFFSAKDKDWFSTDCNLEIKFNIVKNTYRFWTVTHDVYNSFTISINGTDITRSLTKEG